MRKRWLLAPLGLIAAGSIFVYLTRPEQAKTLPPSSVPMVTETIEEKVQDDTIPEVEEQPDPTGYMLMSPESGLTFKSRFGGEHTYNAKFFLGPGTDQISSGMTRESFYDEAMEMGRILEVYPKLNLPVWKIRLGNRLAENVEELDELRGNHETKVMKRDILRNWNLTSQIIIGQDLIDGYSEIDTDYITSTLGQEGALRASYPIDTMSKFVFTPGTSPESGSVSITDYFLVTDEDGNVTPEIRDDWGTRTYSDSPRGSFKGWYDGAMLRTIYNTERLDDEGPSAQLIGRSHIDFGFDTYQKDTSQLAVNK